MSPLSVFKLMHKTLLVLAAGMGSRYGGLKQIDPVGPSGETIIDYSVHDAIRAGFDHLVFVIRRDIEAAFRERIGSRFEPFISVDYVYQELTSLPPGFTVPEGRQKPWGTGHAILMGADVIRGPFGVINADDFYGTESFRLLADHLNPSNPDYAMVAFVLRNTLSEFGSVARGVCQSAGGELQDVREVVGIEKDGNRARYRDASGGAQVLTGDELVSMNMWGFQSDLFCELREHFQKFLEEHGHEQKSEFYIPGLINSLVQNGRKRVKVLRTNAQWFGVTYREDRPHVEQGIRQLVRDGHYPERLWQ